MFEEGELVKIDPALISLLSGYRDDLPRLGIVMATAAGVSWTDYFVFYRGQRIMCAWFELERL